jgi:hypothetical protein
VLLRKGGIRARGKACTSTIVPLMVNDPHTNPQIQYDTGNMRQALLITDWQRLTIMERDVTVRPIGFIYIFMIMRYYREMYSAWLDGKDEDDDEGWSVITDESWEALLKI